VAKNAKLLAQNFSKLSKYPIIMIILMMMPYIEKFKNIFPENLPVLGGGEDNFHRIGFCHNPEKVSEAGKTFGFRRKPLLRKTGA
jgi:hypothetical protein